jgi:hypothetical protein
LHLAPAIPQRIPFPVVGLGIIHNISWFFDNIVNLWWSWQPSFFLLLVLAKISWCNITTTIGQRITGNQILGAPNTKLLLEKWTRRLHGRLTHTHTPQGRKQETDIGTHTLSLTEHLQLYRHLIMFFKNLKGLK